MNNSSCKCPNITNYPGCNNTTATIYVDNSTTIILYTLYVIVLLIGVIGNVMTLAVTIIQKTMRRSIHLYVFNLAICDMLILLFYVPNEMSRIQNQTRYVWGIEMCKITYVILPISICSSSGTLLAITIDRAYGVLRPFDWRAVDGNRRYVFIIPAVWISSILINIPNLIYSTLDDWNSGKACTLKFDHIVEYSYAFFVVVFLLPLLIIFILHILMINTVFKESVLVKQRAHVAMIKMTASIVIVFAICWGLQYIYEFHFQKMCLAPKTDGILFFGANFVVSLQAAINPIIYGTFRNDFHVAFKQLILKLGKILHICYVGEPKSNMTHGISSFLNIHMLSLAFVLRKKMHTEIEDLDSGGDNVEPINGFAASEVPDPNQISAIECSPGVSLEDILRSPSSLRGVLRSASPHLDMNGNSGDVGKTRDASNDDSIEEVKSMNQADIGELLSDLRDTDILETFARRSRLSCDYIDYISTVDSLELQKLYPTYQNISLLDFLQWYRSAKETDL